MAFLLFAGVCLMLISGYPVAFALAGTSLIFVAVGILTDTFDSAFIAAVPNRIYSIMTNQVLIAVPLFVFMGVMLERSKIAEDLLGAMADLFGKLKGGLGISVTLVGALLAASTGIVGATVVTMGLLSLPTMLKRGYDGGISSGIICASGTLGQIIPPSIVLILLGDVMSAAYSKSQLEQGIFSPDTVSVGDLFAGALVPGLILVMLYIVYLVLTSVFKPSVLPSYKSSAPAGAAAIIKALLPPVMLIFTVLGSILAGIATPTEAASLGAIGAMILAAFKKTLTLKALKSVMEETVNITGMVFMILIAASIFSLTFRGFGGDEVVENYLTELPGGVFTSVLLVMVVIFLLGFILDFIEITFMVVPIVAPILLAMGLSPVWLGVMIALNLQTSFLTPPFGFSLFYLRGVAPPAISTATIYRGVMPFIGIQILILLLVAFFPDITNWLPTMLD